MNYLAHAYLSFNQPSILVGNMCSDFIKGKKQYDYPPAIQKGIQLHRAIDQFTDEHAATAMVKSYFRPVYRLYSGAFGDVAYDHFLATDPLHFNTESLAAFTQATYQTLQQNHIHLPERFAGMLPYMRSQNWLYNYQFAWGIQKSFEGLVRRSAYLTESVKAFEIFETHYPSFQEAYDIFFPELFAFTKARLEELQ